MGLFSLGSAALSHWGLTKDFDAQFGLFEGILSYGEDDDRRL
jgi:hypothetical protein